MRRCIHFQTGGDSNHQDETARCHAAVHSIRSMKPTCHAAVHSSPSRRCKEARCTAGRNPAGDSRAEALANCEGKQRPLGEPAAHLQYECNQFATASDRKLRASAKAFAFRRLLMCCACDSIGIWPRAARPCNWTHQCGVNGRLGALPTGQSICQDLDAAAISQGYTRTYASRHSRAPLPSPTLPCRVKASRTLHNRSDGARNATGSSNRLSNRTSGHVSRLVVPGGTSTLGQGQRNGSSKRMRPSRPRRLPAILAAELQGRSTSAGGGHPPSASPSHGGFASSARSGVAP